MPSDVSTDDEIEGYMDVPKMTTSQIQRHTCKYKHLAESRSLKLSKTLNDISENFVISKLTGKNYYIWIQKVKARISQQNSESLFDVHFPGEGKLLNVLHEPNSFNWNDIKTDISGI